MGQQTPKTAKEVVQVYNLYSRQVKIQSSLYSHQYETHNNYSKKVIRQLFESFQKYPQYSWAQQILPLFKKYFLKDFESLWKMDKQKFYQILCESCGIKNRPCSFTYQRLFYEKGPQNTRLSESFINNDQRQISALNCSILNEQQEFPFLSVKKTNLNKIYSMVQKNNLPQNTYETHRDVKSYSEQYTDFELQRSSVIVPQTIFIDRMTQPEKNQINQLLNTYKKFSNTLQMMIRTVNILSCPMKHFETSLKRKVKKKRIVRHEICQKFLEDTREAAIIRKNKQSNNCMLLMEIRDFVDAYTEFLWKYLELFQMEQGSLSNLITLDSANGIVLKIVWSFSGWIGDRGSQWQQMQLGKSVEKLKKFNNPCIKIPQQMILLGCTMKTECNPQKYLKNIVIIYRQLGKICENADQLLVYFEKLIYEIVVRKCHQKIFRMQGIIDKLIKMENVGGQIGYAWTTWKIILEYLKKQILELDKIHINT